MHVIRRFAEPRNWNATSPVMECHQQTAAGNARIVETMFRYFRFPDGFREFRLSQPGAAGARHQDRRALLAQPQAALHGHALLAAQRHLAGRSPGRASTTAAWKTLHYHARRFFLPLALAARIEEGGLILSAMNDSRAPERVEARVRRLTFDGKLLGEESVSGEVPVERAIQIATADVPAGEDFFFVIDGRKRGAADSTRPCGSSSCP